MAGNYEKIAELFVNNPERKIWIEFIAHTFSVEFVVGLVQVEYFFHTKDTSNVKKMQPALPGVKKWRSKY